MSEKKEVNYCVEEYSWSCPKCKERKWEYDLPEFPECSCGFKGKWNSPEPKQDWDEEEIIQILFEVIPPKELIQFIATREGVEYLESIAKALIQHFTAPAKVEIK